MNHGHGTAVDLKEQERTMLRPPPPITGSMRDRNVLNHRNRLLVLTDDTYGVVIHLDIRPELTRCFPDRSRKARERFLRFFRRVDPDLFQATVLSDTAVRLPKRLQPAQLNSLEAKLSKQLYRPLSAREAVAFLKIDKNAFRSLKADLGIAPCKHVSTKRHGKSYRYAVYAVTDLIEARSLMLMRGGELKTARAAA